MYSNLFVLSDIDLLTGRRSKMRCSRSKANTIRKKELSEDTESATALERANSFHYENPYFIREMHRSYICSNFLVHHLIRQSIYLYIRCFDTPHRCS